MSQRQKRNLGIGTAALLFAAIVCFVLMYVYDIVGGGNFEHITLQIIGLTALCSAVAMVASSLARLEDPEEEQSVYHADHTRLP